MMSIANVTKPFNILAMVGGNIIITKDRCNDRGLFVYLFVCLFFCLCKFVKTNLDILFDFEK